MNKLTIRGLAFGLLALILTSCQTGTHLTPSEIKTYAKGVTLLDRETAGRDLATEDEYIKAFSRFDLESRFDVSKPLTDSERMAFFASKTRDWTPEEKDRVRLAAARIFQALEQKGVQLRLPEPIKIIKTNGGEEGDGGYPYTRMDHIVFTQDYLDHTSVKKFTWVLAHEIFHVFSRYNRQSRDQLYAVIGFEPAPELAFPEKLEDLRITNPDAVQYRHYFKAELEGESHYFVPILFAKEPYEKERGVRFLSYQQLRMLAVDTSQSPAQPIYKDGEPLMVKYQQLPELKKITGGNTRYYIHPEEVLADNFAYFVMDTVVPSPEIPKRLIAAMQAISAQ